MAYGSNPSGQLPARGQLLIQEPREQSPWTSGDAQLIISLLFEKTEGVVNSNSKLVVDHLNSVFLKIVQSLCQEVSGPVKSAVDQMHSSTHTNFSSLSDSTQSLILSFHTMKSTLESSFSAGSGA
jgi:hypothetical protein